MADKPTEAIILSAGAGLRLWPVTEDTPKCLVKVRGKPLLQYQLDWLRRFDIEKVVVTIRKEHWRKSEEIKQLGKITVSLEDEPLGTAGGLRQALDLVERNTFLCLNTDDITDIDLSKVFLLKPPVVCVARMRSHFGIVEFEGDKVTSFQEKPLLPYYVHCGCCFFSKDIGLPEKGSLERDVLPNLVREGKLRAYRHEGLWVTVNTLKDVREAEEQIG